METALPIDKATAQVNLSFDAVIDKLNQRRECLLIDLEQFAGHKVLALEKQLKILNLLAAQMNAALDDNQKSFYELFNELKICSVASATPEESQATELVDVDVNLFGSNFNAMRSGIVNSSTSTSLSSGHTETAANASRDDVDTAILLPVPPYQVELEYKYNLFGDVGVFQWIGSKGGTDEYVNPQQSGEVVVSASSVAAMGCNLAAFVSKGVNRQGHLFTSNKDESWISVDLGHSRKMIVNDYVLRHYYDKANVVRNWCLQGKNDDEPWLNLLTHHEDTSLAQTSWAAAHWQVLDYHSQSPYRYFRLFQHGPNSSETNHLVCHGIELFGILFVE